MSLSDDLNLAQGILPSKGILPTLWNSVGHSHFTEWKIKPKKMLETSPKSTKD